MIRNSAINLMLKIGLAVSSLVFAIVSLVRANDVLFYYPEFIVSIFGEAVTLIAGALIALALTGWILSQKHKFAASFTYVIVIGLGMLVNFTSLTFLAMAWPLFCIAGALSLRYYPRIRILIPDKNGEEKMKIVPLDEASAETSETNEMSETDDTSDDTDDDETNDEGVADADKKNKHTNDRSTVRASAESAPVYEVEAPFIEHAPHSDEDRHYTPLSEFPVYISSTISTDNKPVYDHTLTDADISDKQNELTSSDLTIDPTIVLPSTDVVDELHTVYEPEHTPATPEDNAVTEPVHFSPIASSASVASFYSLDTTPTAISPSTTPRAKRVYTKRVAKTTTLAHEKEANAASPTPELTHAHARSHTHTNIRSIRKPRLGARTLTTPLTTSSIAASMATPSSAPTYTRTRTSRISETATHAPAKKTAKRIARKPHTSSSDL
jgi:hypothetical protein